MIAKFCNMIDVLLEHLYFCIVTECFCYVTKIQVYIMNDLSISDVLALRDDRRGGGYGYEDYGYRHRGHATATTGVALAAGLGGGALLLAIAGLWGVNQASKSRSIGNQNTMNAQAKANSDLVALLANRIVADNQRADNITLDVNNKLYALQGQTANATGGTATSQALATAEALALINQQNNANPLSSVIQQNCALRVQRVSEQNCGCGCGN